MIKYIRFLVALVLSIVNLVFLSSCAFLICCGQFLCFRRLGFVRIDIWATHIVHKLISLHSANLRRILYFVCEVRLQPFLSESLCLQRSYIMVINHRSYVDILILLAFFYDKIPNMKFFLKRALFYVPFMGQFCYLMNYIFVRKISSHILRRNPEVIIQQREKISQQCRVLVQKPVTLAVFAEGTRFNLHKHQQSAIQFRNLLSPQPAGLALALESCAGHVHELIDVTLVYDIDVISVWKLLSGTVNTVEIHVSVYNMTQLNLIGNYVQDRRFRKRFIAWVKKLWLRKDALLAHARTRLQSISG